MKPAKNQKQLYIPIASFINGKHRVTMNTKHQFMITVIPDAVPLNSTGNNSAIIIQGIGPKPREKEMMNSTKHTRGIQPTLATL